MCILLVTGFYIFFHQCFKCILKDMNVNFIIENITEHVFSEPKIEIAIII